MRTYSLYRNFRLTAGLSQIEKREFLIRPPAAKNESEVYDCIIAREREVKAQEKLVPAASRPILSKTIKGAVIKNISVGSIREYIKTHEAIKDFDVLREEVLQMAMFNRTEQNAHAQKSIPMELNAVMNKLRGQMGQILTSVKERDFNFGVGKGDGQPINANDETNVSNVDKFVAEINAMMKGKGKGKGVVCYNCGETGHYAKDCWLEKGEGDQKGYQSKGQTGWNAKGDIKGGGKGTDVNEGCFICGGMHWARDCPKGKGKGVNGIDCSTINDATGFPAKKEVDQAQFDYDDNWQSSIEYETHAWIKNEKIQKTQPTQTENQWNEVNELKNGKFNKLKTATIEQSEILSLNEQIETCINKDKEIAQQSENVIMNVRGTWKKITFIGDSGAVD